MKISFVVQGPILPYTVDCCASIRNFFPDNEIILSTWQNEKTTGISFDKLILSKDPGNSKMNVSRQIVSSANGILQASHDIIMKLRTDIIFTGADCLSHLGCWTKRSGNFRIFTERIIIPNMQTVDPENTEDATWKRCFNASDWVMLGTKEDLSYLFEIPLEEATTTNKSPEQYIWLKAIQKTTAIDIDDMTHVTPELIKLTYQFFANNTVILNTKEQFKFYSSKYAYQEDNWPRFMQHSKWLQLYEAL